MTNKPTYYELLRMPQWQKKRLEIMQRENFSCERCFCTDRMLHVHHSYYEKGLKPWEYPDSSLHCLCENCHKETQDVMTLLHRHLGRLTVHEIDELYGMALGRFAAENPDVPIEVPSLSVAEGIGLVWNLSLQDVAATLIERTTDGESLRAYTDTLLRALKTFQAGHQLRLIEHKPEPGTGSGE